MPPMPEMGPSHDDVEAEFANCTLNGDFIDSMSDKGDFILSFKNCTVNGAISTGVSYHPQGMPQESKWWLIGMIEHTLCPNDEDEKGIKVSLDEKSAWTVTKNSCMNELNIAPGATLSAPAGKALKMVVNGEETAIAPGSYTGKIIITVA